MFLPNVRGVIVAFSIFDISVCSGDIRYQSLKLSDTAPNLGPFSPSQILGVWAPISCSQIVMPASRHVERLCEATPPSPKVIGVHTVNVGAIFEFSHLKIVRGTPIQGGVGHSLARVKI